MQDFNTRLLDAGIDPADVDYQRVGFQRLRTEDKPGKRNAAVKVMNTHPLKVWYQNHGTGVTGTATEHIISNIFRPDPKLRQQAEQAQRQGQNNAAALAESGWHESPGAGPGHAYLVAKGVQPHGLRQSEDGYLLVPLYGSGLLWNLQTISPTGEKRFLSGGRKKSCYYPIGDRPVDALLLCEGFATGASLFEALGLPVVVAFDCGNLIHVGRTLRARYPKLEFIYAADNDSQTDGNPGLTAATAAAAATKGWVVYPTFDGDPSSDWNDFASLYGLDAVRSAIQGARHER